MNNIFRIINSSKVQKNILRYLKINEEYENKNIFVQKEFEVI